MALFSVKNVSIKGIAACVPRNSLSNLEAFGNVSEDDMKRIAATTGIENRRIVAHDLCTSDLCFHAASQLIEELGWDRNEIDILIFISQTPDYILPMTSTILQNRLGLGTHCLCFDTTLGCSGYTYGLSIISSILSTKKGGKGLLLVGDTISKLTSPNDRSTFPLFGDSGTATALSFEDTFNKSIYFQLGSDGDGANAIIIPDGGQRNPTSKESFLYKEEEGKLHNNCQLELNGMDVFNFGIKTAPMSVKEVIAFAESNNDDIDYFIFHQANKLMNETIRKKLKLPVEKVPYSLSKFANTSSATIPLTMVDRT